MDTNGGCAFMGNFPCGVETLKCFVNVHLHCNHGRRKNFFQGGALGDFYKFFLGEAKSGDICFFPFGNYEDNHFC